MGIKREEEVVELLIAWYQQTKRPLPWRATYTPYHIWISEIMLQQTQMERGIGYFNRWVEKFPDVASVAAADENEILRLWQGLGYYSRAANIYKAAHKIMQQFDGIVPDDYSSLLTLPGIGTYTAAAIASIAGKHNVAVVDANVARVYARIFDIDENIKSGSGLKRVRTLAEKLLPAGKARDYNQALMDFGGLLCTPKSPRCEKCPIAHICLAYKKGIVAERPQLPAKKKTVLEKKIVGVIVNAVDGERIFIYQRKKGKLWAGLWDLPGGLVPVTKRLADSTIVEQIVSDAAGFPVVACRYLITVQHQYTHHKREVECWLCRSVRQVPDVDGCWVTFDALSEYAFPAGARKIFSKGCELFGIKSS